jgi:hypothetical protein
MTGPGKVIMCAICFRTLNVLRTPFGDTRTHTSQDPDDHPAVPVEADERWLGRCDFCNDASPVFRLPVRDFRLPNDRTAGSTGDWTACRECAQLIDCDAWELLTARAIRSYRQRGKSISAAQEAMVRRTYVKLRANVRGNLRPL